MRSDRIKKGFERSPHRSLLKATGVTDADMGKPFVAVCNSYIDIIPGHVHLQRFGALIKEAVRQAGGVALRVQHDRHRRRDRDGPCRHELLAARVGSLSPTRSKPSSTRTRSMRMICLPNCDKIVPGMLMGALRVDIPTIFVSGGPMAAGNMPDGRAVDLVSVFEGVGAYKAGKIDEAELKLLEDHGCPSCGSCSGMFTANSMNCLLEAIGLALPYNGSALAGPEGGAQLARTAAHQ